MGEGAGEGVGVEVGEGGDLWQLTVSGRYAHTPAYVIAAGVEAGGLRLIKEEAITPRCPNPKSQTLNPSSRRKPSLSVTTVCCFIQFIYSSRPAHTAIHSSFRHRTHFSLLRASVAGHFSSVSRSSFQRQVRRAKDGGSV